MNDAAATYAALEAEWDAAADVPSSRTTYERALNGSWETDAGGDRSLWAPALMAPLAEKASFECPPTHIDFLKAMLPNVDLIYTIGWRAQERHFLSMLDPMRNNPPDVIAVTKGAGSSAEVAERIRAATGRPDGVAEGQLALGDPRPGFSGLRAETEDFPSELGERINVARGRRTRPA